tara:strand:+ start:1261 stop:1881 length:621 start_codon:yes stop_codon:yes gene_type:complete
MSYAAAGAFMSLASSYMAWQAQKEAGRLEGDELDLTAEETLKGGKYYIGKLIDQGFAQSRSALEGAADTESLIKRKGAKKTGKIVATIGSSGVKLSSGTAAQQIIKSGLDNAAHILQNQEALDIALTNIENQTDSAIEKTKYDTITKYNKLKRMADLARKGGNAAMFASMMGGMVKAGSTYKNLGGDFSEFGGDEQETDTDINRVR